MEIKTPDWLSTFTEGKGKKISRILFRKYYDQDGVTKEYNFTAWKRAKEKNPRKAYVLKEVNELFQTWEYEGFIDNSPPLRENHRLVNEEMRKKLRYLPKDYCLSTINFKPIYRYFLEKYKITFSQEEIEFLESKEAKIFRLQWQREQILNEYQDDNILDAIIKFYVKHNAIPNIEVLDKSKREMWDMTERHIEEELKRGEELKKGTLKKREKPSILRAYIKELDAKKLSPEERHEWADTFSHLFDYIINFKTNPQLVSSINKKFKKALGII